MTVDIQSFQQDISKTNFNLAVVLGCIPGIIHDIKFGYVNAISSVGDIWPNGGNYIFPVEGGQILEAVSTNINDINWLNLNGIDGITREVKNELVQLTGTTPVVVQGVWEAVNSASVIDETEAIGEISIQGTGNPNNNIFAVILPQDQLATQCPYKSPANKVVILNALGAGLNSGGGGSDSCIIKLSMKPTNGVTRTLVRFGLQKEGNSLLSTNIIDPILIPPASEIRLTVDPTSTMDISGFYSMNLIEKYLLPPFLLDSIGG